MIKICNDHLEPPKGRPRILAEKIEWALDTVVRPSISLVNALQLVSFSLDASIAMLN